jgi:predicted MPP superfamily phosphohydrolase
LITGDLVSWSGDYEKAFEFISKLKSKVGIWAVLGDADYQNSRKACIFCHSSKFKRVSFPVKFLRNQSIFLPVGQSRVAISGIEINKRDPAGYQSILKRNDGYPEILLSHDQFDLDQAEKAALFVLSGNTHGGQVYMPDFLWRKIFGDGKGAVRSGMETDGAKRLYVTTGVGTNFLPLRFLCPPEIVVFVTD